MRRKNRGLEERTRMSYSSLVLVFSSPESGQKVTRRNRGRAGSTRTKKGRECRARVSSSPPQICDTVVGGDEWNQKLADSKFSDSLTFGKRTSGHIGLQDHGKKSGFVWPSCVLLSKDELQIRIRRISAANRCVSNSWLVCVARTCSGSGEPCSSRTMAEVATLR